MAVGRLQAGGLVEFDRLELELPATRQSRAEREAKGRSRPPCAGQAKSIPRSIPRSWPTAGLPSAAAAAPGCGSVRRVLAAAPATPAALTRRSRASHGSPSASRRAPRGWAPSRSRPPRRSLPPFAVPARRRHRRRLATARAASPVAAWRSPRPPRRSHRGGRRRPLGQRCPGAESRDRRGRSRRARPTPPGTRSPAPASPERAPGKPLTAVPARARAGPPARRRATGRSRRGRPRLPPPGSTAARAAPRRRRSFPIRRPAPRPAPPPTRPSPGRAIAGCGSRSALSAVRLRTATLRPAPRRRPESAASVRARLRRAHPPRRRGSR